MHVDTPAISVCILARNEEALIGEAVLSAAWADDVLVLDDGSTDRTADIARSLGARVVSTSRNPDPNFDGARNLANEHALGDWIWFQDADERPPAGLIPIIRRLVNEHGSEFSGVRFPFKHYFCGKWIQHSGWWPGYTRPQLLKRGAFRYNSRLHAGPEVDGPVRIFPWQDHSLAIDHHSYRDLGHYLSKLGPYTDGEAISLRDEGGSHSWRACLAGFVHDWRVYYDQNEGWKDGLHGFVLAFMSASYRMLARLKLWDLRRRNGELLRPAEIPQSVGEILAFMRRVAAEGPEAWVRSDYPPPERIARSIPEEWLRKPPGDYGLPSRPAAAPSITAVILARNEEGRIEDALRSLQGLATQIIVIDNESDDRTVEIAQRYADLVLSAPRALNFDAYRSLALPHATGDWILFLDADERIPSSLAGSLLQLLQTHGEEFDALYLPSRNYVCGKWLSSPAWWPGYSRPYLLRKGSFDYRRELHAGVEVNGRPLRFPANDPELAVVHESHADVASYLDKLTRYTAAEAENMARVGQSHAWQAQLADFTQDWVAHYDHLQARLDGMHGFAFAFLCSLYRFVARARLWDLRRSRGDWDPEEAVPRSVPEILDFMAAVLEKGPGDWLKRRHIPAPNAPPIPLLLCAPLYDPSGYAADARMLFEGLTHAGVEVSVSPMEWGQADAGIGDRLRRRLEDSTVPADSPAEIFVTQTTPPLNRPSPQARLSAARTMFETDGLPQGWSEILNRLDRIWVPSEFNRETFARAGVDPTKIAVIPGALDAAPFLEATEPLPLPFPETVEDDTPFTFLSVFDWTRHKGWDSLLEAFAQEFGADPHVRLLIKTWSSIHYTLDDIRGQADRHLRLRLGSGLESLPNIVIWQENLPAVDLPRLYRSVDAFVLPTRGEGWCRPLMEAMAAALPTAATGWSGLTAFHDEKVGYSIQYTLQAVPEDAAREIPIYAGQQWAEPDIDHLRSVLRRIQRFPREAHRRGRAGRKRVVEQFSPAAVSEIFRAEVAYCRELASQRPPRRAAQREVPLAELGPLRRPPANPLRIDIPEREDLARVLGRPIRICWEGDFSLLSSLALVNRELVLALQRLSGDGEVELSLRQRRTPWHRMDFVGDPELSRLLPLLDAELSGPPDITIRHHFPPDWSKPAAGKLVVIQPWELSHLPRKDWIEGARRADEVWVYSRFVRDVYLRSGVPAEKLRIIPLGVQTEIFSPEGPRLDLPTQKRTRFLFVGGALHRKGVDRLLAAYRQAFTRADDVVLVIKDLGTGSFYQGQTLAREIAAAASDPDGPEIIYSDRDLDPAGLAALFRACTCVALPSRGEGFGLPPLEGMACGLPAIVTAGGAMDDYADDLVALRVPHRRRMLNGQFNGEGGSELEPWELEPDLQALSEALLWIHRNPDKMPERRAAAIETARAWNWERSASLIRSRLAALLTEPRPPETVKPYRPPKGAARSVEPITAPKRGGRGSKGPTVSLCMIVRNEERCIGDCLASAAPHVDEMVVVDTGSTDRTPLIAWEMGARVFRLGWPDSFAAARNASLAEATCDYVVWLDADDILPEETGKEIRRLVRSRPRVDTAWKMVVRIPPGSESEPEHLVEHVKLFPRLDLHGKPVQWEFRIHEQILPALQRAGIKVLPSGAHVIHANYDRSPEGQRTKRLRDDRLLELDLRDRPDHAFTLYNLGMTALEARGDLELAAHYLERSLSRSAPEHSIVAPGFGFLVKARMLAEEWELALRANEAGRRYLPDDPQLLLQGGEILQRFGRFEDARKLLEALCQGEAGDDPRQGEADLRTARGPCALAGLFARMGDLGHAEEVLQEVVHRHPRFEPARKQLEECLLALGRLNVERRPSGDQTPPHPLPVPHPPAISATTAAVRGPRRRTARNRWSLRRVNGIGDIVFCLSVAQALKDEHPGCSIRFHTAERHVPWVSLFNCVDEVVSAELKEERGRTCVDFEDGFPHGADGDRTIALCSQLGVKPGAWLRSPTFPERLRREARRLVGKTSKPILLLAPVANRRHTTRSLSPQVARDLATQLAADHTVVWAEEDRTERPLPKEVIDLSGRLRVDELLALLHLADRCVSVDSGVLYLAVTMRKPVVGVYTHIHPEHRLGLAEQFIALRPILPCAPCGEVDGAFQCLYAPETQPPIPPLLCARTIGFELIEAAVRACGQPAREIWEVAPDGSHCVVRLPALGAT